MTSRRTQTVDLSLFGADALGSVVSTGPRPAEQYEQIEFAVQPETARMEAPESGPCCDSCAQLVRDLNTPTADYQGLKAGDAITVQWVQGVTMPAVVVSTCLFGALVRAQGPLRDFEMYVCTQNHLGNWHR